MYLIIANVVHFGMAVGCWFHFLSTVYTVFFTRLYKAKVVYFYLRHVNCRVTRDEIIMKFYQRRQHEPLTSHLEGFALRNSI